MAKRTCWYSGKKCSLPTCDGCWLNKTQISQISQQNEEVS